MRATLLAGSIFLCYSGFAYSQVGKVHPAISSAALGIRWGELRIHPAFSLTEQYESNVFQTPTNEQGDFSTRISPGFALHLPLSRHDFFGGYRAEFVKYGSLKNQDTVNHFATLGMKLDFPGGLLVNMDNVFSKSTEAPLSDVTGPVKNRQDVLRTSVEYRLAERYSVGLSHNLYYIDYLEQQNEFLDRVENRVGLTGFYRVFPKTRCPFRTRLWEDSVPSKLEHKSGRQQLRLSGGLARRTHRQAPRAYQSRLSVSRPSSRWVENHLVVW